jgi:hypothetical protein
MTTVAITSAKIAASLRFPTTLAERVRGSALFDCLTNSDGVSEKLATVPSDLPPGPKIPDYPR